MDEVVIERLLRRDTIERRFEELFTTQISGKDIIGTEKSNKEGEKLFNSLKNDIRKKEIEIYQLNETIKMKDKMIENVNNELLELTIEDNMLNQKYLELKKEHDTLVERWLKRVQDQADHLNVSNIDIGKDN
ncbi:hypothetical protein TBLA_0B07350 [Henningerozyma blattae CBS 6284]|uniref:Autophagy-related protein 16 domain-containing protein n=1 Tax=Henningerozyma blattae (strain ATCC 34711 / CBS 6284 / DSM 70876 / NBRC 10599 / NRRL Y-10934 / UCD 77-7) TaxID=1071380 RepID=I2GZK1_HENB6|nr:hypothetical protein TBLA_0B07350 [Tetrapisispora blattae CBS 6284]CCH59553.1 hypothetical protein TBLA_0B07350 [Tetrapisispora blattae CBS 6284]